MWGAVSQLQLLCDQTRGTNSVNYARFPRAAAIVDIVDSADLLGRSPCAGKKNSYEIALGVDGIGGQVRTASCQRLPALSVLLFAAMHMFRSSMSCTSHSKAWHGTTRACDDGRLNLPFMCRNVCDRSFFSKAPTEKASPATVSPGDQFLYQEDWGEKYTGVRFQHPTNIAFKTVRNCEMTRKGRTAAASPLWDRLIILDMCDSIF